MLSARAQARVHTGVSLPCWTDEAGDLRDRRGTVRYPSVASGSRTRPASWECTYHRPRLLTVVTADTVPLTSILRAPDARRFGRLQEPTIPPACAAPGSPSTAACQLRPLRPARHCRRPSPRGRGRERAGGFGEPRCTLLALSRVPSSEDAAAGRVAPASRGRTWVRSGS